MRVPSTKVQNNFGKYLKYVEVNEEIIITKKGKDVARLISHIKKNKEDLLEEAAEYKTSDLVTYKEFLELTENSEQRFELIDGIVYYMPSPSYRHQYAVSEIHGAFYNWFKGKKCTTLTSPYDVTFLKEENNICVVQPDIIVLCDKENIDKKGKYKGIPRLVIEVLSPSTRSKDMLKKLDLYKRCEVKEYWIVDTKSEQILVYSLLDYDIDECKAYRNKGEEFVESSIFKGLKVALSEIFDSI